MSTSYKGTSKFVASMISDMQKLTQPKDVHVCDGSAQEAEQLIQVRNCEFSRPRRGTFFSCSPCWSCNSL